MSTIELMKHLLTILFIFIMLPNKAQETRITEVDYSVFESTTILHINQKWYAKIIQKRFDKAIASNHFFECEKQYCFEVDEEDVDLKFGIFNRRVVPKRLKKNVEVYYITGIVTPEGFNLYLE